jgi:hypothetical protein
MRKRATNKHNFEYNDYKKIGRQLVDTSVDPFPMLAIKKRQAEDRAPSDRKQPNQHGNH